MWLCHGLVCLRMQRCLHAPSADLPCLHPLPTAALCTVVKKVLKQPRPAATCTLLGNCHKHGMPSSHSAVMAFAATTALLLYLHRRRASSSSGSSNGICSAGIRGAGAARTARRSGAAAAASKGSSGGGDFVAAAVERLAQALPLLEVLLLWVLTAAVAYGRVHLGYHTPAQVAAGLALGSSLAAAWWCITLAVCQRWGPVLRLPLLRALHFRDTLGCPDVHAAEAEIFVQTADTANKRSE